MERKTSGRGRRIAQRSDQAARRVNQHNRKTAVKTPTVVASARAVRDADRRHRYVPHEVLECSHRDRKIREHHSEQDQAV